MDTQILSEMESQMKAALDNLQGEFNKMRSGRANVNLVADIKVQYYGNPTPLSQVGTITTPQPKLIVIQPWDKGTLADIEKAIMASNIGLTPQNDGRLIRLPIPLLTEERRKELVKLANSRAEEARVFVRLARKTGNNEVKKGQKAGDISEDEEKRMEETIQKKTDEAIKSVNELFEKKKAE